MTNPHGILVRKL